MEYDIFAMITTLLNHGGLGLSAIEILCSDSTEPLFAAWLAYVAGLFFGEVWVELTKRRRKNNV